jgi:hypothetical protein
MQDRAAEGQAVQQVQEASAGGLIFVEGDPGVPSGRGGDAGLSSDARAQLHLLLEGKAIGTAQLSANVLARDSVIRRRTALADLSIQRFRMREASTNAGRAIRRLTVRTRDAVRPALQALAAGGNLRDAQEATAPIWREAYEEVRRVGRQASALESLGDATIMREEETWFRGAVREELAYWNTFLAEIDAGSVLPDRLAERFDAYLKALRFMYESSRVQALPDNVLFYWMGPEDAGNCPGCVYLLERSPFTKDNLPAVPRDGVTRCLTNCRHRIVVRVPRDLSEVFKRRRDLPKRSVMIKELKKLKEKRRTVRASRAARNPFRNDPITAPPRQHPRTATFRESVEEGLPAAVGNCYESAANYIVDAMMREGRDVKLVLVHGEITGQGRIEGVRYGHAWVEDGAMVIDNSNGRDLRMHRDAYYALARVGHRNPNLVKYTVAEMRKKIIKHKHYGPWDLKTSTGL